VLREALADFVRGDEQKASDARERRVERLGARVVGRAHLDAARG